MPSTTFHFHQKQQVVHVLLSNNWIKFILVRVVIAGEQLDYQKISNSTSQRVAINNPFLLLLLLLSSLFMSVLSRLTLSLAGLTIQLIFVESSNYDMNNSSNKSGSHKSSYHHHHHRQQLKINNKPTSNNSSSSSNFSNNNIVVKSRLSDSIYSSNSCCNCRSSSCINFVSCHMVLHELSPKLGTIAINVVSKTITVDSLDYIHMSKSNFSPADQCGNKIGNSPNRWHIQTN